MGWKPVSRQIMNHDICVIGLGYIGLPTASIFATRGKQVLGVDVSPDIAAKINAGEIHIEEPELDIMVRAAVNSGALKAATEPQAAETYIIAVPTPIRADSGGKNEPDNSYVEQAARAVATVVAEGNLVIVESTCAVGTTEKVRDWVAEELEVLGRKVSVDGIHFVHCPERVLPGQMLKELVSNDRICGGLTPSAARRARDLYRTFCTAEIMLTDAATAEMAKLTENASRDVAIAFANELSLLCDRFGLDAWEVIELANRHPRVHIMQPGPGVGGHCIAVDPWFLISSQPDVCSLMSQARAVNDGKPGWVVDKVVRTAAELDDPLIACFGLAFKADVDDLRESPALEIAEALAEKFGDRVLAVEPHTDELPESLRRHGARQASIDEALEDADLVVLLVDHRDFLDIDPTRLMRKAVVDTRGRWRYLKSAR